jgi:hypothetical protein
MYECTYIKYSSVLDAIMLANTFSGFWFGLFWQERVFSLRLAAFLLQLPMSDFCLVPRKCSPLFRARLAGNEFAKDAQIKIGKMWFCGAEFYATKRLFGTKLCRWMGIEMRSKPGKLAVSPSTNEQIQICRAEVT